MPTAVDKFKHALAENAAAYGVALGDEDVGRLSDYYLLLLKWNYRLHLVAPCSPETFATRHVLESLMLLRHLTRDAVVVDIGTGGGLPIIPCLIARDDLHATLIESSHRKSAFLKEALRLIKATDRAQVITARFESLERPAGTFVTCRALDHFAELLPKLVRWSGPGSNFLFYVGEDLRRRLAALLAHVTIEQIPQSQRRFLLIGRQP